MKKQKGHPKAAQKNTRSHSITELLKACQGISYYRWLVAVANNPGILTHDLTDKIGLHSNNHHNADQKLNPVIGRYGWRIEKQIRTKANESWGWYLVKLDGEGEQ